MTSAPPRLDRKCKCRPLRESRTEQKKTSFLVAVHTRFKCTKGNTEKRVVGLVAAIDRKRGEAPDSTIWRFSSGPAKQAPASVGETNKTKDARNRGTNTARRKQWLEGRKGIRKRKQATRQSTKEDERGQGVFQGIPVGGADGQPRRSHRPPWRPAAGWESMVRR